LGENKRWNQNQWLQMIYLKELIESMTSQGDWPYAILHAQNTMDDFVTICYFEDLLCWSFAGGFDVSKR
jgi:hypothetical protein